MDSLTHTVFGACLGEIIAGKKLGKKAMLFGALASNAPDLDFILNFTHSQADSLLAHRGFSHSLLLAILVTPILSLLAQRFFGKPEMRYRDWNILWGSGILLHIFLDLFTVYGVGFFEPFHSYRVAFNIFFVADPLFTLPLLVAALVLIFKSIRYDGRIRTAIAGLSFCFLYMAYAVANKWETDRVCKKNFINQNIQVEKYFSTPTPMNSWLWYIVAKTPDGYRTGYYSVFDKDDQVDFSYVSSNDSLLNSIRNEEEVQTLLRFSQGYYRVEQSGDTTLICDLRFGEVAGWYKKNPPFVFRFALEDKIDNTIVIQKGRLEASSPEALKALYKRICGKEKITAEL